MAKFKHNKLKNTGMLFEFLLRQVTVDVLNKKKTSKAVKIIKKRFNENTEVGKELGLYNLLLKKKFEAYHLRTLLLIWTNKEYLQQS